MPQEQMSRYSAHERIGNMDGARFGALIRARREDLGIRSYELAQRIGRQPSLISRLETGAYKDTPPPDILAALERELGVSQREMLTALGYLADAPPRPAGGPGDRFERVVRAASPE